MTATNTLITLVGSVALTLYGVRLVRMGVLQAFGAGLRNLIERYTQKRLAAFGVGVVVTGLVQSATATALLVTDFASRGLIPVSAALAVLLGADLGTSVVAQILALDISFAAPILILCGMVGQRFYALGRGNHVAHALIGLGLMLLGLQFIVHAADPLKDSYALSAVLKSLGNDQFFAFLIGILFTWAAHSSLASVLLVMSFAQSGLIPLETALVFVLGAHVGTAITPVILNGNKAGAGRTVAVGGLLIRLLSALCVLPFLQQINQLVIIYLGNNPGQQVVNFHTALSVVRGLGFLPFVGLIARALDKILPTAVAEHNPAQPQYLQMGDLATPNIALMSAARETLRLGDIVLAMLKDFMTVLDADDSRKIKNFKATDDIIDALYEQIKLYLIKISRAPLTEKQSARHMQILMFATNLEHVGDIIDRNLFALAEKRLRHHVHFSAEGLLEIENYHQLVCHNFTLSLNLLMASDPATQSELARALVAGKEGGQKASALTAKNHFERIQQGNIDTLHTSSLHLDIVRDLKRINDYMTHVAYHILEAEGQLQSRIKG